jgi:hypothetical protein
LCIILNFEPAHALVGGTLLGLASIARLTLSGRILGVSGIAGGLARGGARDAERWLFVGGLASAGFAMAAGGGGLYPSAFGTSDAPA